MSSNNKVLALPEDLSEHIVINREGKIPGGVQVVVRFPNNYGASIVHNEYSYGVELAVVKFYADADDHFDLDYSTHITDDVLGWLDKETLIEALRQIQQLPTTEYPEVTTNKE